MIVSRASYNVDLTQKNSDQRFPKTNIWQYSFISPTETSQYIFFSSPKSAEQAMFTIINNYTSEAANIPLL